MDIRGVDLVCSVPGFGACPDRDLRMMARRILIVLCFVFLHLASRPLNSAWSRRSSAVVFSRRKNMYRRYPKPPVFVRGGLYGPTS